MPRRLPMLPLVLAALLLASAADAQYFGRNKVQWEDFDFHVLETEHFEVYHYPPAIDAAEDAARMSERWYGRLSEVFDHQFEQRKPIILYANHADFQQTTVSGGLISQGVGGFTESVQNRLVMPLTGAPAETDHVLGHEMVHVFQFDIMRTLSKVFRNSRLRPLPLWMTEGLAEYLSVGPRSPLTAMWLRDAVIRDALPDFKTMSRDPDYFPYRWGHAFWAYVGGRWSDHEVVKLYVNALLQGPEAATEEVLGLSPDQLFVDWREQIRESERAVIDRYGGRRGGTPILGGGDDDASLNVGPVLSPDGRRLAFLSSRELLSVDLFVADAATGEVTHRLASARGNPHFDALRFIDSSGTWSPDGERIAFVVFARGDNRVTIADAATGATISRLRVDGLESILHLAWSPRGGTLAVSASVNGVSDLFLVDVSTGRTRQLTDDAHAELQPAWSPDGETIAFVSDRGDGTDLAELRFGEPGIELLDVVTGDVRRLQLFAGARHGSPQFSADGRSLYVVADPDGVANVYRYDLMGGGLFRVTDVATGVSGITADAPALSAARDADRLAYTVFEGADYVVFTLEGEATAGQPVDAERLAGLDAGQLPRPGAETGSEVARLLEDATTGLPAKAPRVVKPYQPRFKLRAAGPTTAGVAYDDYGLGVAGGVNLYFSDVLGEHQLGVNLSGGSYVEGDFDIGAQAVYLNRTGRLNWGANVLRVPYRRIATTVFEDTVEIDGTPVLADIYRQLRETVTVVRGGVIGLYPLSLTKRLEATLNYTNFGFDSELDQAVVVGGTVVDRSQESLESRPGYGYGQAALAWVADTSTFGFTSPLAGTRLRLETGRTFGDFAFTTALVDVRRYISFRPASLAVRLFHFGRYGGQAEDPRIAPLYLGRETLMRGYSAASFDASECTPVPAAPGACPEVDRLEGSRIAVLNLELRLQVLGTESFGLVEAPFLATELVGFVDVGAAWSRRQGLELRFDEDTPERVPVVSAGVAARILLGGYVPIEVYSAHPFQRPGKSWVVGLLVAPGW